MTRAYQVGGDHYSKHAVQPWDIIQAYDMGFFEGNALKYLLRHRDKGKREDILKALHYLQYLADNYDTLVK